MSTEALRNNLTPISQSGMYSLPIEVARGIEIAVGYNPNDEKASLEGLTHQQIRDRLQDLSIDMTGDEFGALVKMITQSDNVLLDYLTTGK